ncbi:MAG TPA: DUF2145 domain-containing protein [Burkholderiaceae bacterium]|nr:DUF2145 domain-containing protein [Burkholderiaceae bacterium]
MTGCERSARALLLAALGSIACGAGHAGALQFCDHPAALNAAQKDTLLRFGAIIKTELENSGARLALVARSGLDLSRFGLRYSHAGFSLKASPNTPWSVRQLYYACDEGRPRIFDQGLAGFLLGTDDPAIGYVSVVLMPAAQAGELERAALNNARALQLLNAAYSANAYAWGLQYQNCNQWVVEMLASAWGRIDDDADAPRAQAQRWLAAHDYAPSRVEVGNRALIWASAFVPWLHSDDHPRGDLAQRVYRVSMPAAIESFVRSTLPAASRIEFCHTDRHVVVHRGWEPIAEGCTPGAQDTVIPLAD